MAACEETREQMKKELSNYYVKDKCKFLSSKKAKNGAKNGSQYDEIFLDSGKELFEEFKNSDYSKKRKPKAIKKPIKRRKSTMVNVSLKEKSTILDVMFNTTPDPSVPPPSPRAYSHARLCLGAPVVQLRQLWPKTS